MRNAILICLFTLTTQAIAQEVYKEVGDDGVPVFSDQASPEAEVVEIEEPVTFNTDALQEAIQTRQALEKEEEDHRKNIKYSLAIVDPANNASIRDNAGNLTLSVNISPSVARGHQAELLMDGDIIRTLGGSGDVRLTNLDRGTHWFTVRVVDENGETVSESSSVSISILRYAIPRPKVSPS